MTSYLPESPILPISALSSSFDEVTNSYKFYWFLAILESVRENQDRILTIDSLLARMTASVWYPVNYFRLSFGKQDQLGKVITILGEKSGLAMDSQHPIVNQTALVHLKQRDEIGNEILSLGNFVPYRFLRPFFAMTLRGAKDWEVNRRIRDLANQEFTSARPCLYRFVDSTDFVAVRRPLYAHQKASAEFAAFINPSLE